MDTGHDKGQMDNGTDSVVLECLESDIKMEEPEQDADDERGCTFSEEGAAKEEQHNQNIEIPYPIQKMQIGDEFETGGNNDDDFDAKSKPDSGFDDVTHDAKIEDADKKFKSSIWELLKANIPVKDIAKQIECPEKAVYILQKSIGKGNTGRIERFRLEVSSLLDANVKTKDICRITNCSPRTVYKLMKMKKEGKDLKPNFRGNYAGRKVRTEDLKEFVKTMWHPSMSIHSLAKQTNVSQNTLMTAFREDIPDPQTTGKRKGGNKKRTKVQRKHESGQIDGNQKGLKRGRPKVDRPDELSCDTCKKVVKSWESLRDHKRTHTGEKPFTCPYCDYCGSSSSLLAHHKRQRHKEERAREEREKEKKRDEMVQKYLHKSVMEESVSGEGEKNKEGHDDLENITDKQDNTDHQDITDQQDITDKED